MNLEKHLITALWTFLLILALFCLVEAKNYTLEKTKVKVLCAQNQEIEMREFCRL